MPVDWLEQNLIGVCWIGIVGSAIGLLGLTCRRGHGIAAPLVLAAVLGGAAAILATAGSLIGLWLAPAILAATCAGAAILRSPHSAVALAAMLKLATLPRTHAAILLVGSPIAAACWAWAIAPTAPELQIEDPPIPEKAIQNKQLADAAATDSGRSVPLYARLVNASSTDLRTVDKRTFAARECAGRALRTAQPSDDYNCHGWVFTDGRFGIQSEDVDGILQDNGYHEVTDPRPGDVVIYRAANTITHSGIVRTAGAGQPMLVESKWGLCGRYVHAPQDSPYEGAPTFYHTDRSGGHVLRGVDRVSPTQHFAATAPEVDAAH